MLRYGILIIKDPLKALFASRLLFLLVWLPLANVTNSIESIAHETSFKAIVLIS